VAPILHPMQIRQFALEGLGHLSALIYDDAEGVGAVVDPRRDVDVYLDAAHSAGVRITHVVETHLHNDYVSGGRDLATLTGATHLIGAGAELAYEHRPARNGESFDVGALRLVALDTPGHTPEHVAYAVADRTRADEPALLFTGGSLLVGSVGRTDLLGSENAVPYARHMFRSLHDVVLRHEDFVGVMPTHGAGSLCSIGISATPQSTIGFERRYNRMLQPTDVDEFARRLLKDQPAFPAYFARMRPTNKQGPRLLLGNVPEPQPLSPHDADAHVRQGAQIVDLRPPADFAAAHIPGSVSIPSGSSFGTWLGWIIDLEQPIVFVLSDPADGDDAIRQALRIGHDDVVGYVDGGITAWRSAGLPLETSGRLTVAELASQLHGSDAPVVIDVRQTTEYADGHIPGSLHLFAGDLAERLADLPRDRPIAAICASGFRASIAASLLSSAGFRDVFWVAQGVPAWESQGYPIERGAAVPAIGQPER
jgi:hydroxyacylglutathione hydrolase